MVASAPSRGRRCGTFRRASASFRTGSRPAACSSVCAGLDGAHERAPHRGRAAIACIAFTQQVWPQGRIARRSHQEEWLLPGIAINTAPTDYNPIKQMQMMRFNGETWEPVGPVLNGDLGGT